VSDDEQGARVEQPVEVVVENLEIKKDGVLPLYAQLNKQADKMKAGFDIPEMFPHLCEAEADVQYFESRVTKDGYSPITAEIFIAKAYNRGDVLKYISMRYPNAGTIKVRKLRVLKKIVLFGGERSGDDLNIGKEPTRDEIDLFEPSSLSL